MLLCPEPVFACIDALNSEREYEEVIFFLLDAELFFQTMAN